MLPTPRARLTGEAANYKPGTSVEVRFGEQWVPGRVHEVRSVGVGFCPIVVKTENGTLLHCKIGPDLRLPLDN